MINNTEEAKEMEVEKLNRIYIDFMLNLSEVKKEVGSKAAKGYERKTLYNNYKRKSKLLDYPDIYEA